MRRHPKRPPTARNRVRLYLKLERRAQAEHAQRCFDRATKRFQGSVPTYPSGQSKLEGQP